MVDTWDVDKVASAIADTDDAEIVAEVRTQLQNHLDLGKGIALYRNEDFGHPMLGHAMAFTYGTQQAQLEPAQFPDGPPQQCPDGIARAITGGINWRYQLVAVIPVGSHG